MKDTDIAVTAVIIKIGDKEFRLTRREAALLKGELDDIFATNMRAVKVRRYLSEHNLQPPTKRTPEQELNVWSLLADRLRYVSQFAFNK